MSKLIGLSLCLVIGALQDDAGADLFLNSEDEYFGSSRGLLTGYFIFQLLAWLFSGIVFVRIAHKFVKYTEKIRHAVASDKKAFMITDEDPDYIVNQL